MTEILPQMITLSESYVQIWQRTSPPFKDVVKNRAGSVATGPGVANNGTAQAGGDQQATTNKVEDSSNKGGADVEMDVTASGDSPSKGLKRKLGEE